MSATGATLVHPYNDPHVIAGQGTVALEILEQLSEIDAVVCPVGGGGLLSGTLMTVKSLNPSIRIYAAEPAWADDCARSLRSGAIEQNTRYDTIADGLRTPLGTLTFPIIRAMVDDVLLADEQSIINATMQIQADLRVIAEPSGAVSLAAIQLNPKLFAGKRVAVIISGGNLDCTTFPVSGRNSVPFLKRVQ